MSIYIPLPVLAFILFAIGYVVIRMWRNSQKAKENTVKYMGNMDLERVKGDFGAGN